MWELNTLSRQNKSDNKRHQQDKKVSWNAAYNLFIDTSSAVRQKQKEHFGFYVIHLLYMDFSSSLTESLRCYLRLYYFLYLPLSACFAVCTPRNTRTSKSKDISNCQKYNIKVRGNQSQCWLSIWRYAHAPHYY